jgi:chemotaxis protein methyltransferase CheR
MNDHYCIEFLQWCLPALDMHWEGFRKVRKQVCKRIRKRMQELDLSETSDYRQYLEAHPEEWEVLDSLCYITISRFYRDRKTFEDIGTIVLPALIKSLPRSGDREIRAWSAGCCSGEEPYSLNLLWKLMVEPGLEESCRLSIVATEKNGALLQRATEGVFNPGSLKHLPLSFRENGFDRERERFRIKDIYKANLVFRQQDIRRQMPDGSCQLILCRNLAFTYFNLRLRKKILKELQHKLSEDGFLIIGAHEHLPEGFDRIHSLPQNRHIYRKM